jgi:hypothetical protein
MSVTSLDIIAQYSADSRALNARDALVQQMGRWTLVAETMSVSIGTVKSHRESAMRKLRGEHFSRTLTLAMRRGLVSLNPTQEERNE